MADDPHPETVTKGIDRLTTSMLDVVQRLLIGQGKGVPVPIVIHRGGLLMLDASRRAVGAGPWGFLLPATRGRGERVTIQRVDIPIAAPGATYLLIDPIVNSGETVLAAVSKLEEAMSVAASSLESISLACIFLTKRAEDLSGRQLAFVQVSELSGLTGRQTRFRPCRDVENVSAAPTYR